MQLLTCINSSSVRTLKSYRRCARK